MKKALPIFSAVTVIIYLSALSSCHNNSDGEQYLTDTASLSKGEIEFGKHCSSCHNFYHDDIAPQLATVTAHQSFSWIRTFISNPAAVIKSGDTTAKKLLEEYKSTMPSFASLGEVKLTEIVSYIRSQRHPEPPYEEPDTTDLKNPLSEKIGNSNLTVGLKLFTQIPKSSFDTPLTRIVKMDFIPNSNQLFVLDQRGKLYSLQNGQPQVYMDMARLRPAFITGPGLATGFGSFAFHPDFQTNGLFYTTHAESVGSGNPDFSYDSSVVTLQWVLTEWKTKPGIIPFTGSSRELLRVNMPTSMHGVQEIAFNKKAKKGEADYGLLYIGIGDGGSTNVGKPLVNGRPEKIWGSVLHIDPSLHNSANGKYGIPATNPFADSPADHYAREVYAYGFRNPHRLSWGKEDELFAANIGEHNIESINLIEPGHFYGWPLTEGTFREKFYNHSGRVYPLSGNDSLLHVSFPVAQFDHDEGTATSGGFEYAGSQVGELQGKFVFGDIGTGKLFYALVSEMKPGHQAVIRKWQVTYNGKPTTLAALTGSDRVDLRFGMDGSGELYILTKADGKIYRLVANK